MRLRCTLKTPNPLVNFVGNWTDGVEMTPWRRIVVFTSDKLDQIIESVGRNFPQWRGIVLSAWRRCKPPRCPSSAPALAAKTLQQLLCWLTLLQSCSTEIYWLNPLSFRSASSWYTCLTLHLIYLIMASDGRKLFIYGVDQNLQNVELQVSSFSLLHNGMVFNNSHFKV